MSQDYNSTINLPKTDFPMRAGLPKREPDMLTSWEEQGLYELLMEKNADLPLFVFHDGPPYANGDIHLGHALNKILKDFIVRYKNMSGFRCPYIPGWDTHGLPIESQVIKKFGLSRAEFGTVEFREKCREFALSYVNNQKEQFKRLGNLAEWDKPYLTLHYEFEAKQIELFGEMAEKGLIYKGLKPVYWCPHDETALAEAEIEYADDKCESIYVKFKVTEDFGKLSSIVPLENTYFVIWTTTTWTLPGNVAIALNGEFEYVIVSANGENYIMAEDLVSSVMSAAGIESYEILAKLPGTDFENMKTQHPFLDRQSLIILGDHVTLDAGTGCVHTAPGHGAEDYVACRGYDLPIVVPVDSKGYLNEEAGKFAGLYYDKASEAILDELKESGALLTSQAIVHPYPHCWRCKHPIIYRATEQWFASVDAIKDAAVEACHGVTWLPNWGEDRIISMVRERSDWCISRQRIWGVPIPIFYCEACNEPIINPETIAKVSAIFREEGSSAWYAKDASELLPEGFVCPKCGKNHFTKETDIMDVWFDSGSSHAAVLETRDNMTWPADLYLEGADQHRGWFQSSLLTSIATRNAAPYKTVITHGMVVDGEGKKMSKSMGNVSSPLDIIKTYGADILRLWVSSADYRVDVRISEDIFKQLSEIYLKIRNTARFMLGNLNGFDPDNALAYSELEEMDKWALMRLNQLIEKVHDAYENYEFHIIYHAIHNFCVVDMSNFYLDVAKDRLYCDDTNGKSRRGAQTVMYKILDAMVRMLAPILAFTSNEIWLAMPHGKDADVRNVVLNQMPNVESAYNDDALMAKWEKIHALRDDVNRALEAARAAREIGKSLEANVKIFAEGEDLALLREIESKLASLFIVSKVELVEGKGEGMQGENFANITVAISRAEGVKCPRCWAFFTEGSTNSDHPDLCPRCAEVVSKL
ncbi:MAG: isoleucine--tRNA ligase [Clostridia bacterium]|nr:isoleucine--tRNA ligase [Clostridia bacterium]